MRTKTLALSALLGMLGSASLVAQTNVYSLNAVGYINVVLPPGFSILTCPLICSPNNQIGTLFNNSAGQYQGANGGCQEYSFGGGTYLLTSPDICGYLGSSYANGWLNGGTDTLNPGQAVFFFNPNPPGGANFTNTFVGTVPQSTTPTNSQLPTGLTNVFNAGFNLVGSMVPTSGDFATNSIMSNFFNNFSGNPTGPSVGDYVYTYDPVAAFSAAIIWAPYAYGGWLGGPGTNGPSGPNGGGDPVTTNVSQGFFYYNSQSSVTWIENFTINP
jgi:hypothetical protein